MKKHITLVLILIAMGISLMLHVAKLGQVPPCLNADEAAFGYNSYSILKTGRDEYGAFLPLRLKSFGEQKMPLYAFLAVPGIAILGLNDFSVRLPNIIIGVLFVPLMYLITREIFKKKEIALLACFITAFSPAVYIASRHAHEGVSSAFLVLLGFLFLLKWIRCKSNVFFLLTNAFFLFSTFAYHSARIYLLLFIGIQIFYIFKLKLNKALLFVLIATLFIPFSVDMIYGTNRVNNLFFTNNEGFHLRLAEYLRENRNPLLYNVGTQAFSEVIQRYARQISPDFLVVSGDLDQRFGFTNMGPITPLEYIFMFFGVAYLFLKKERYRYLLTLFLFTGPLINALTWRDPSLTRTYLFFFPLFLIVSYATYTFWETHAKTKKTRVIFILLFAVFYGFFLIRNWDLYLNHYPKRDQTRLSWQCGYRELTSFVKENYDKFDHFYITNALGQPYIYMLFYSQFDPKEYQKQAAISAPDKYGFGQVHKYDKFIFSISDLPKDKKSVVIGIPEDFQVMDISSFDKSSIPGDPRFVVLTRK